MADMLGLGDTHFVRPRPADYRPGACRVCMSQLETSDLHGCVDILNSI